MNSLIVDLNISAENYQRLYAGAAKDVYVRARDGRRVRFPARILRSYVRHDGVRGSFVIEYDTDNRFKTIHPLVE